MYFTKKLQLIIGKMHGLDKHRENLISLTVGLFAICLFYVCIKKYWYNMPYAADYLLYLMQGKDIFSGNVFLKEWIVSTNSFYFLSIVYGFLGKIFGYNIGLVAKVTSLIYGAIFFLISKVICRICDEKDYSPIALIIYLMMIIFMNGYNDGQIMFAGSHQDVTILGLIVILFFINENNYKSKIKLLLLIIYIGIELFSDQLTLAYVIAPLFMFAIIKIAKKELKKGLCIAMTSAVSFVIGKIISIIFDCSNGLVLQEGASETSICDTNTVIDNIGLYFRELLMCFGGDIFEKKLEIQNGVYFINCLVFITLLLLILCKKSRIRANDVVIFMACQLFVITAMDILLYYPLHFGGINYAIRLAGPLFVAITIAFGAFLCNIRIIPERILVISGIIVILVNCINIFCNSKASQLITDSEMYQQISSDLYDRNLSRGYGSYYETFPITVASGFDVELRAIMGPDLSRFIALNKKSNDWDYANFIFVNNKVDLSFGLTEDVIYNIIGEPKEKIEYCDGGFTLYIWDKNIIPYIKDIKD